MNPKISSSPEFVGIIPKKLRKRLFMGYTFDTINNPDNSTVAI